MVLVAAALLLGACDSGTPSRPASSTSASLRTQCQQTVDTMLDATQRYIDTLAPAARAPGSGQPPTPSQSPSRSPTGTAAAPTAADLQAQLKAADATLVRLGCDPADTARNLDAKWSRLRAEGAVARAVLAQLRTTLLGPAAPASTTTRVPAGADLEDVLASAGEGATLELARGTYRLEQSLVVLRPVTLRGAGRGQTVLLTSAADDGLLVLTSGAVTLRDLSVRHTGTARATLVSATAGAALTLDGVEVSGATKVKGVGGTGLLMAEPAGSGAGNSARTTTLTVRNGLFTGNQAGAVVVAGRHRASVTASTFTGNRQCGVCFLGSSDGWVQDNTFRDNEVGVAAAGSARPIIRRNTFSGGQVGIQIGGRAAATVERNTINGSQRAAMIYLDTAAGTVDGNTCGKGTPGIVIVGKGPYPYLETNDCTAATTQ